MIKKCDSTLFRKVNYEVSLINSNMGIFSLNIYSRSCLLDDAIEEKAKGDGFEVKKNKGKDETKIEIQITPQNGSLSDIKSELHSTLSKASEYNVLYSKDREAIMGKFNQFLKDNKMEYKCSTQAPLGSFSSGGNAF